MFYSKNIVNPHLAGDSFFEKRSSRGILLLHGLTATTNSVRPLASRLGELDWTTSAPLLPGHGESLEKLSTTNWRDWAAQVEQYWHQLNDSCDESFIAGESAGGLLALWLACLQTIRPKGLVLVAPALQLNLPNWKRQLIWLLSFFKSTFPKEKKSSDIEWQGYPEHSLKAVLQLIDLQNLVLGIIPQLEQKILVVEGGQDDVIGPGVSSLLLKKAERSEVKSIFVEKAGHHPMLEKTSNDYVLSEIVNFLQKS